MRDILNNILEEIDYVERAAGKSGVIDLVLSGSWLRKDSDYFDDYRVVGRGRGFGDVGVLRKQSRRKPSAAYESVLRNLFSVQSERRKR